MNRIEKAVNYALNTLEQHLPERFLYHSLHHTCNVIKYSGVFAQQSGLCQHEQEIIRVAAAFHAADNGKVERLRAARRARRCHIGR